MGEIRNFSEIFRIIFRKVIDHRQITHLICARLKHLLYDFWGGVLGFLPVVVLI